MLEDFITIAFRNLTHRSVRSWLTLLGIFIGIAAVVSLVSLGDGLQNAVTSTFSDVGTDKLVVTAQEAGFGPPGSTAVKRLTEDDVDAIRRIRGVKTVANRLLRSTNIKFNDFRRTMFVVSVPEATEERRLVMDAINVEISEGRFLKDGDKFKATIGNDFVEQDFFDKDVKLGNSLNVNGYDVEIIGFMEKFSNPQFNSMILMNQDAMEEILEIDNEADIVAVQVQNVNEIEEVAERIRKELRKRRDVKEGKEDFSVETPDQAVESFNTILNLVQSVIVGIAGISLIVGGIGIANTMFTSVLERRREIGIMKAVGARNNSILALFLLESGILGMVGSIIGIILGVAFSKLVEYIGNQFLSEGLLTPHFSLTLILGSLAFGFLVGSISGIVPAKQASMLQPVEALRK